MTGRRLNALFLLVADLRLLGVTCWMVSPGNADPTLRVRVAPERELSVLVIEAGGRWSYVWGKSAAMPIDDPMTAAALIARAAR
ncbi:hypothetical protein [Actinomadura macrotermitis]|uniref:hypothetical protein n=1 Tax=Actinomadura macrotermitis TaxID=2585200 RepID=UPI0012961AEE|nr:hypothetical protein [Actinomadura macrotermitis]